MGIRNLDIPSFSSNTKMLYTSTLHGFPELTGMKAVQIPDYGPIKEMVKVEENVPIPRLSSLPPKKQNDYLILKTLAVSLAPGDVRVLSGETRELQGPPSFPYIPGGDCCGIVVEVSDQKGKEDLDVKVGDVVAARFHDAPRNCMAEYAIVHKAVCDKVPLEDVFPESAAALASASPAVLLADKVKKGERVLVFGAGGGVGSHLCQCLREQGASFIAGVSKDPDRLLDKPLMYDAAIDYTKEDVWTNEDFLKEPFDVVYDLASGKWPEMQKALKAKGPQIIKSASNGGRFLTVTVDTPYYEIHSIWQALKLFLFPSLWRAFKSRTYKRKTLPKFSYSLNLPQDKGVVTRMLKKAQEGKLKACIDGPYDFTTEGVQEAFTIQKNHHPKGKVVVKIADN